MECKYSINPNIEHGLCCKCAKFFQDLRGIIVCHDGHTVITESHLISVENCEHFIPKAGVSVYENMSDSQRERYKISLRDTWNQWESLGKIIPGSGIENCEQFIEESIKIIKSMDINSI